MKNVIIALLIVFVSACGSDAPSEPNYGIDSPPPDTDVLRGTWKDATGFVLSESGLYDSYYKEHYATDLRVSNGVVWFRATGTAQIVEFYGEISGDAITGTQQLHNYSVTQGITFSYPERQNTYVRTP